MKCCRKAERGGGLFCAIEHEQAVAAKTTGILKLRDVIPWESFRTLLEGWRNREAATEPTHRLRHARLGQGRQASI